MTLATLIRTLALLAVCGSACAQSDPPPGTCVINLAKSFGDATGATACYAAASGTLANGSSKSFPNARAGYTGSITASCAAGKVSWDAGNCDFIATLPASMATAEEVRSGSAGSVPDGTAYKIGTHYYPGWKAGQVGNAYPKPWDPLRLYRDREPLLGQYAEDGEGVMTQQLKWMRDYGIDYVVFNWLWGRDNRPYLAHGVNAYLKAPSRHGVEFAIQWSNHTNYTFSKAQFEALFTFWVKHYLKHPAYLKVNGKPAVFIFEARILNANAAAIGMSSASLLAMADRVAQSAGLPGISFIGGASGNLPGFDYTAQSGYAGLSAYNFHGAVSFWYPGKRSMSHSYNELDAGYRDQWAWMRKHANFGQYIVPMSSGWDKRPWGGSSDPKHDDSRSVPAQFEQHLLAARKFMDEQPAGTQKMGVICCWNEFGEGSMIEPTKEDGFAYLEQVRKVFGPK